MTIDELQRLLPLIALAVAAVATMLAIGFHRNLALTAMLSVAGLLLAIAMLPVAASSGATDVSSLLSIDGYALFFMGLFFAAGFVVVVLSYGYMQRRAGEREEFFVLILLAALGAAVLVASTHFVSFLLGLEILTVSLYAMIAYTRLRESSVEAGVKYLILASSSAAFLLLGMAFIYAATGTMDFSSIAKATQGGAAADSLLVLAGGGLVVVGIGFKLAVVPFHMWTPDVYEGAPVPATAFVATVSKGAMIALLVRFFAHWSPDPSSALFLIFSLIAIASMLAGNLLALLQNNVKRLLAYSSIAHLGYILVAFLASGSLAIYALTFYVVAYFVTSLIAFGVVTALSRAERDADRLEQYEGLVWREPYLGLALVAAVLSLAGIPMTAGFIGKFYVAMAGVGSDLWTLVIILALSSAIGVFYYLRLVVVLFRRTPELEPGEILPPLPNSTSVVLGALALILIWLGVYPSPMLDLIRAMVTAT